LLLLDFLNRSLAVGYEQVEMLDLFRVEQLHDDFVGDASEFVGF
jgi:hypothetical protein